MVLRLNRTTQSQPDHLNGFSDGQILHGPPLDGPVIFQENGLFFEAEPIEGQKTGFFLDQRENRSKVEEVVAEASGRFEVLNVFAYTGGFSLYAARGGASRVVSLDISAPALAAAERNFALNQADPRVAAARHEILAADAFAALAEMADAGRRFEMVIVDPPAFAKRQDEVDRALGAYTKLAHLALGVLQARRHLGHVLLLQPGDRGRVLRGHPRRRPGRPPSSARDRPHGPSPGSSGWVCGGGVFEVSFCRSSVIIRN